MAEITLDRKMIMSYLVSLVKLLAEAFDWACQRKGKITFEVPDTYWSRRSGDTCYRRVPPRGRNEAELLIGILKMSKKGH